MTSYKELQQALKSYKEQGLTSIKLNSKQSVLQEEYARLTAQQVTETKGVEEALPQCSAYETSCPITSQWEGVPVQAKLNCTVESASASASSSSTRGSSYPFNKNTVKVENKPAAHAVERSETTVKELFTTRVIPAMNSKYAPSWLCKPYTVYVIDGIEYLPHELEMNLKGQVCELPAASNERKLAANKAPRHQEPVLAERKSNARPATPIVNPAKELPKVAVAFKAQEDYSPYFIDTSKAARYSKSLGTTERQAARNLEDGMKYASSATKQGFRNVVSFAKGFHARQVERALKVNTVQLRLKVM